MRLAHLILTHTFPEQLNRLVGKLAHKNADFYIHVDQKTDIRPFLYIENTANVHFVVNRVKINWAGYSMVQATLNGMAEILASGVQYDYINLLSGQDYPIKNTGDIHNFFEANPGKIFMRTLSVQNEWKEAIPRIEKYYLPDANFPGKYKALALVNKLIPTRRMPMALTAVGRSQWFTIPPACATYIAAYLQQHASVKRFFKTSWAPDEMIFQTILYNSPYKKHMVNDNLLYVDWSDGSTSPKTLTMEDAGRLNSSDKLFARKFNCEIDSEILDHLDKTMSRA